MEEIKKRAVKINKKNPVKILFLEPEDKRVSKAIDIIQKQKIAEPIFMFGNIKEKIKEAKKLLEQGKVDAIITGATHPSVLTLLLSFNFKDRNFNRVSGSFLMLNDKNKKLKRFLLFADCAAQPDPSSKGIAEIAFLSSKTFELITRRKAHIALLSYSTHGSGKGKSPEKIRKALKILKNKYPKLKVEGEIQADAALIPDVAKIKRVKDNANVLIFPNLDSANIGYKLVERLGKWKAIGPILQGLNKQINDLSRGCSIEDIINLSEITVLQVNEKRKKEKNQK